MSLSLAVSAGTAGWVDEWWRAWDFAQACGGVRRNWDVFRSRREPSKREMFKSHREPSLAFAVALLAGALGLSGDAGRTGVPRWVCRSGLGLLL